MKDIRHLQYNDIMGFKNRLSKEKELSAKTSYNIINVLKKLLRDAWRNEDIAYVPPFPPISYVPPEIKYLTYEQQQKILDAIPEKERPIFIFMMEYGLRLCEAQALQKDCVTGDEVIIRRSLVEHKLREATKTGRKGFWRFKLTPVAREALKNVRLSTSPYVFVKETEDP